MKDLKEVIQLDEAALVTLKMPVALFYDIYNVLCDIREKKWAKLKKMEQYDQNYDPIKMSQEFYNSMQK